MVNTEELVKIVKYNILKKRGIKSTNNCGVHTFITEFNLGPK